MARISMYCFLLTHYYYRLVHFVSSVHGYESILIVTSYELNVLQQVKNMLNICYVGKCCCYVFI